MKQALVFWGFPRITCARRGGSATISSNMIATAGDHYGTTPLCNHFNGRGESRVGDHLTSQLTAFHSHILDSSFHRQMPGSSCYLFLSLTSALFVALIAPLNMGHVGFSKGSSHETPRRNPRGCHMLPPGSQFARRDPRC